MCDEKHGNALTTQTLNHFNQVVHFTTGQRCGWLVHDDELGAGCDGARDGNQLAHCKRQLGYNCVEKSLVCREANGTQCTFCGLTKLRKLDATKQPAIAFNKLLI